MRPNQRRLLLTALLSGLPPSVWATDVLAARQRAIPPATHWQEDFRRCLVRKPFDRGHLSLSTTNGALEIYVRWSGDMGLDELKETTIRVEIDQKQFELPSQKDDTGEMTYAYHLGPFTTIAPLLTKGRWLTLALPDHPNRNLRLAIGNGKKAVRFLKTCQTYWEKWRKRHP